MTEEIKKIFYKLRSDDYYEEHYQQSVYYERDLKKLENYITNLQKENEELKDTIKKDNHLLGCNFSKKDKYKQERDIYKQRNEKAIEYIKNDLQISILPNNQIINGTEVVKRINKIVNILQGGDE